MQSLTLKGEQARNALNQGINQITDCVKITYGPNGRNVVLQNNKWKYPTVTNDGVTIAKNIELKDSFQNLGCKIIQQAADETNKGAGDGTTTSIILAQGFIHSGIKLITAGESAEDILNGMEKAIDLVISRLKESSNVLETNEQIKNLATISSGDKKIGDLIAQAYNKVGKDGIIQFELGKKQETYLEFDEGIKFNKGYLSPLMVNIKDKGYVELDNPLILITDDRISYIYQIMNVLEKVVSSKRPLLIIAEDISMDLLKLLLSNKKRGTMEVVVVSTPGHGDRRKAYLEDTATITGGTVITEHNGILLEDATEEHLGAARKVIVKKDDTSIIGGYGSKKDIGTRADVLKEKVQELNDGWTKDKLSERLGWLTSGIATIKVGGTTEPEAMRNYYLVEDALNSVKGSIQQGILSGGGVALLNAAQELINVEGDDYSETLGVKLVAETLILPVKNISENCGKNSSEVISEISVLPEGYGYDAESDSYVNMIENGIVDSTQVSIESLKNAYSLAALVINTEALITYKI